MWPDDYMWYPHMFNGKYLEAYFLFEGHNRILKSSISVKDTQGEGAENDQINPLHET